MVAAKWANLKHGSNQNVRMSESPIGDSSKPSATKTRDEASKLLNVGTSSIDRAKRAPRCEEYSGDDPLGFVVSLNDHRRHDTENERAMVGARMANLKNGQMGNGRVGSSMETPTPIITIERAAELSGSTTASIKLAKPIVTTGIPELQDILHLHLDGIDGITGQDIDLEGEITGFPHLDNPVPCIARK